MHLQILKDGNGNNTGIFVPINDWQLIKREYPEIEELIAELPIWEQNLIDDRLDIIAHNPERIIDGAKFIASLKNK
jgi:hypothetical protein